MATVAWRRHLLLAAGLLGLPGCARSEADVRNEFAAYVAGANSCQVAGDCTIANGSCPLPCWVAVRGDRKSDVEAKARDLVEAYNRYGQTCDYDCAIPGPVRCVAARCFVEAEGFGTPSPDAGTDAQ